MSELGPGLSPEVLGQIDGLSAKLSQAGKIACHGVGREGLMMRALAMRLFHLGLPAHVVGDMTTPPVGQGDVLFVSAGPGHFGTIDALRKTAQDAGATVLCITAEAEGAVPRAADHVVVLPAQTMASDQAGAATSVLPMGSLFEAMMFLFFELVVLDLRDRIGATPDAMRARHTNLE
ncbi:MAG: SIS domain-containing protein [Planctomycetota bacterium]